MTLDSLWNPAIRDGTVSALYAAVTLALAAWLASKLARRVKALLFWCLSRLTKNGLAVASFVGDWGLLAFFFFMLSLALRKTGDISRMDVLEISVWGVCSLGWSCWLLLFRRKESKPMAQPAN